MQDRMLDEAIKIGSASVDKANCYLDTTRLLVDAIARALELMKSGRIGDAREVLDDGLLKVARRMQ